MTKKNFLRTALAVSLLAGAGSASALPFTFDYTFGTSAQGAGTQVHGVFTGTWDASHAYVENVAFSSLSYTIGANTTVVSGGPWTAYQYYQNGGTGAGAGDPPFGSPARIYSSLLLNDFFLVDCERTSAVLCTNMADLSVGFLIRSPGVEASGLFKYPNVNGNDWQQLARDNDQQLTGARWLVTEIQSPTSVPEPATLSLLGLGIAGIGLARRRKRMV